MSRRYCCCGSGGEDRGRKCIEASGNRKTAERVPVSARGTYRLC